MSFGEAGQTFHVGSVWTFGPLGMLILVQLTLTFLMTGQAMNIQTHKAKKSLGPSIKFLVLLQRLDVNHFASKASTHAQDLPSFDIC